MDDLDHVGDKEELDRLVRRAAEQLSEHFDSVQIICTARTQEPEGRVTTIHDCGVGNYYARYGSLIEWINFVETNGPSPTGSFSEDDDDD